MFEIPGQDVVADALGGPIGAVAQLFTLAATRLLPIVALTPLFGGRSAPGRLRFGYAVLLTIGLMPVVLSGAEGAAGPMPAGIFLGLMVKEAIVGLTVAVFILTLFESFTAAGALIDLFRGATIANVFDPMTQQQRSILGVFYQQLGIVIFLSLGGHRVVIDALATSYKAIPLTSAVPSAMFEGAGAEPIVRLLGDLLTVAIRLSGPVLVVTLVLDVALGVLNRLVQQVQVYFLGLTVKGSLGVLVLMVSIGVSFDEVFVRFFRLLTSWLSGSGGYG